jgi:hypothetical protein
MSQAAVFELEFVALVASSIIAPATIFGILLWKRAISRTTVLLFGIALIVLSTIDVALLELLETSARLTESAVDDQFFASEVAITLYVLPAVLAGIGTNILSHLLVRHLDDSENRFDREQASAEARRMAPPAGKTRESDGVYVD